MKTVDELRREFESIDRVGEVLSMYNWEFDSYSNQYVLESYHNDQECRKVVSYLDGLWYMFQILRLNDY